ncbi:hypothetical protein M3T53_09450 [Actinomyces sp. B33]|uniref:hypothetical protein n=1 Tax=Actinomyces sp. B33 TaxID=2942131 RepID=UPI002342159F|nr:hypothetical protein [Actinomyces sp. B33]MDC4233919.1 hypothetical protein [Actinomyces sp. B33]
MKPSTTTKGNQTMINRHDGTRNAGTINGHTFTIHGVGPHTDTDTGPILNVPEVQIRDLEDAERLTRILKEYVTLRKRWMK